MKTFVRVLSIIAMMFAFIACSEDIYLHNGEDGLDVSKTKNGVVDVKSIIHKYAGE